MVNTDSMKLELVREIINLPDELLPSVRSFLTKLAADNQSRPVNGASYNQAPGEAAAPASTSSWEQDPILKFIGLASYDPPAKSIDEELYGEAPL